MSLSERIGLLASRIPIAISISILRLRALIGVVTCLLALEAGDVTQVLPHRCGRIEMLLIAISSITIALLVTMVVVSIPSMMNVAPMVMVIPSKLASA